MPFWDDFLQRGQRFQRSLELVHKMTWFKGLILSVISVLTILLCFFTSENSIIECWLFVVQPPVHGFVYRNNNCSICISIIHQCAYHMFLSETQNNKHHTMDCILRIVTANFTVIYFPVNNLVNHKSLFSFQASCCGLQ